MSRTYVTTAYGGPEHQRLSEREAPAPRPGEIAIAVRAAGVNPADVKRREGLFGTSASMPMALGLEASGVVTALGEGVEGFAMGDAVLGEPARGLGAFAEHTVLRARSAARKPAELSFEDAAALPIAGTTASDLVHHLALDPGATVLVLGASGGVGLMALQLAAGQGLRTIGIASERGRAAIEAMGAQFVARGDSVAAAVRELAPSGADLLIDLVGGQALQDAAALARTPEAIVSAADEDVATALGGAGRRRRPEELAEVVAAAAAGRLDPQVRSVLPLEHADEAIALVERGGAGGKVVIRP